MPQIPGSSFCPPCSRQIRIWLQTSPASEAIAADSLEAYRNDPRDVAAGRRFRCEPCALSGREHPAGRCAPVPPLVVLPGRNGHARTQLPASNPQKPGYTWPVRCPGADTGTVCSALVQPPIRPGVDNKELATSAGEALRGPPTGTSELRWAACCRPMDWTVQAVFPNSRLFSATGASAIAALMARLRTVRRYCAVGLPSR